MEPVFLQLDRLPSRAFAVQYRLGASRPGTGALLRFGRTAFHYFHGVRAQTAIHLSLDNWNKEAWNLVELKGKDSTVAARESVKTEAERSHLGRGIYSISVGHASGLRCVGRSSDLATNPTWHELGLRNLRSERRARITRDRKYRPNDAATPDNVGHTRRFEGRKP